MASRHGVDTERDASCRLLLHDTYNPRLRLCASSGTTVHMSVLLCVVADHQIDYKAKCFILLVLKEEVLILTPYALSVLSWTKMA
jgi:hypothetical protein